MRMWLVLAVGAVAACAHHQEEFSSAPPGLNVADVALSNGEPGIALAVADARLAVDPADLGARVRRGEANVQLGRAMAAAADFQYVLARNPRSAAAAKGLGKLDLPGQPQAAELLFYTAVTSTPHDAAAWNDLGIARDLEGRHRDAQAAYRRAIQEGPDMSAAQANLARSLALSQGVE